MKKTSKIIITILLLMVLLIGIGYAAIQNITLNITGTAEAAPSQSNFKVMFSGEPTVSDEAYVVATITDDIHATINVEGLTEKGQMVSATYTVQNVSTDISADLSVSTTNNNPEYFTLSSQIAKTSLIAGEATTLTVTVELTKVPITDEVTSTIGVQLIAMPVEPGQEGTSEEINDFSQNPEPPTLSIVTNDNIGDYIDLGNDIIETNNTTDDWRILYRDNENVYAILSNYLSVKEFTIPSKLKTKYPYSVWSDTDADMLLEELLNNDSWNSLANNITGATVIGSPTIELLIDSHNAKNERKLEYNLSGQYFVETEINYDLYVPQNIIIDGCKGYWISSPSIAGLLATDWLGEIIMVESDSEEYAVRPVVALPLDIECSYENKIWTIKNK